MPYGSLLWKVMASGLAHSHGWVVLMCRPVGLVVTVTSGVDLRLEYSRREAASSWSPAWVFLFPVKVGYTILFTKFALLK